MRGRLISVLKKGGIAVMQTDTILGVVVRARDRLAVARLYALRRQTVRKPFIILISDLVVLRGFGITLSRAKKRFLQDVWPGAVSVILPCRVKELEYLHLGTNSLAFRLPKPARLRALLRRTGPLAAPSANPEGKPPAKTIAQAKRYFGARVDLYASASREPTRKPSTLVSLTEKSPVIIRKGAQFLRVRAAL